MQSQDKSRRLIQFSQLMNELGVIAENCRKSGVPVNEIAPDYIFSLPEGYDYYPLLDDFCLNLKKHQILKFQGISQHIKVGFSEDCLYENNNAEKKIAETIIKSAGVANHFRGVCAIDLMTIQTKAANDILSKVVDFIKSLSDKIKFAFLVPYMGSDDLIRQYAILFEELNVKALVIHPLSCEECVAFACQELARHSLTVSELGQDALSELFELINAKNGHVGLNMVGKIVKDLEYEHIAKHAGSVIKSETVFNYVTDFITKNTLREREINKVGFRVKQ